MGPGGAVAEWLPFQCPLSAPGGEPTVLWRRRGKSGSAVATDLTESCNIILLEQVRQEKEALKKARPLGQKTDQAWARLKSGVEAGEKVGTEDGPGKSSLQEDRRGWREGFVEKAQNIFAAAQEEVFTSPDGPREQYWQVHK